MFVRIMKNEYPMTPTAAARRRLLLALGAGACASTFGPAFAATSSAGFDVRAFGARGDGTTLDNAGGSTTGEYFFA